MKKILILSILAFLLFNCSKNKLEKKGFSVSNTENLIQNTNTKDTLEFRTRPKNILLTNNSDYKLSPIYKINYDKKSKKYFSGSNYSHTNYVYSEKEGNRWNENFMPGFNAIYGYNMVNIAHFNIKTKINKVIFDKPVLIKTLYYPAKTKDTLNFKPVSRNFYMVSVYDEDTNKDGFITVKDLRRFYHFDIEATIKTAIVPKKYSVLNSEYDSLSDYMYIYAKEDKNDNGQMEEKEEIHIFWIDLKNPENTGRLY